MSFETDRRFEMKQRARMRTIQVPPQTQFNTEVEVDKNGKGGTSIDDLPSEILAKLVDILPLNDRLNFGATCQRFESIAKDKLPPLTARRIYLDFQDPASDLEQVITVGNGRREASRIPTYYYPRNMEGPDEGEMKWRRNDSLAWEAFTTRNFKALLSEAIAAVQKRMEITVINLVAGDLTLVSPLSEYIDKSKIESLRFHGDGKTHVSSLREGPVIATLLQDMDNLRTVEISDEGLSEYSDDSLYRQPVFTHVKELTFDSRERRKRCGFKLEMVQNLPELEDLYIFSPIEISVSSVMNLIHFIIGNVSPFRVLHLRIPLRDCVFSIPHVGKRILAEVPTFTIMRRVKSNSLIAKFADLRQRTWSLYLKKSQDEFSVFCACDELVLPPENAP